MRITDNEAELRGKVALNRIAATFALIGALISMHYAYALDGWHGAGFACLTGLLCQITIRRTVRASVLASGLVLAKTLDGLKKDGVLR